VEGFAQRYGHTRPDIAFEPSGATNTWRFFFCATISWHVDPFPAMGARQIPGVEPNFRVLAVRYAEVDDPSHLDHFALQEVLIIGLTQTGRATVRVLAMNSSRQIETRADLE
jgi:hypothetical protein